MLSLNIVTVIKELELTLDTVHANILRSGFSTVWNQIAHPERNAHAILSCTVDQTNAVKTLNGNLLKRF